VISVSFSNLEYSVTEKNGNTKRILHGVAGSIPACQLCAIMGPSGAGKTSLLNILGARVTDGVSGEVLFNDQPPTKASRRLMGFVMQRDIFLETLTVQDTLRTTALLRMPASHTSSEKIKRAETVIDEMGLRKCAHTRIAPQGLRGGGISGGELKRLNVANELLADPALLFLDEPTTGLDSTSALALTASLKTLSQESGRTIVASIHQPSGKVVSLFDFLIVLCDGRIVFQGEPERICPYLAAIGFPCPPGWSASDHMMELVNSADEERKSLLVREYEKRLEWDSESDRFTMRTCSSDRPEALQQQQLQQEGTHPLSASAQTAATSSNNLRLLPIRSGAFPAVPEGEEEGEEGLVGGELVCRKEKARVRTSGSSSLAATAATPAASVSMSQVSPAATAVPSSVYSSPTPLVEAGLQGGSLVGLSRPFSSPSPTGGPAEPPERGGIKGRGDSPPRVLSRELTIEQFVAKFEKRPSWFYLTGVLMQRECKNLEGKILDPPQLLQHVAMCIALGVLFFQTLTERELQENPGAMKTMEGFLFFITIYFCFTPMFNALFVFPAEKRVVAKERSSKAYPFSAYFVSKTVAEIPSQFLIPVLCVSIAYFMSGLYLEPGAFFSTLLIVYVTEMAASAWGLVFSAAIKDFTAMFTSAVVVSQVLFLSSGFLVAAENIPVWIRWVRAISFMRYAYEGAMVVHLEGQQIGETAGDVILRDRLGISISFGGAVAAQMVAAVGLRLLTYLILRFSKSAKQVQ